MEYLLGIWNLFEFEAIYTDLGWIYLPIEHLY